VQESTVEDISRASQPFIKDVDDFMKGMLQLSLGMPGIIFGWILEPLKNWIKQLLEDFMKFIAEQVNNFKKYVFENTMEYMKTTAYENFKQICIQNNLPYPKKEDVEAEMDSLIPLVKESLGVE